jgi:NADPH2:quinone reductase
MRGIQISEHGGPEAINWRELPDPEAGRDEIIVDGGRR